MVYFNKANEIIMYSSRRDLNEFGKGREKQQSVVVSETHDFAKAFVKVSCYVLQNY